ncbi:oxidoreductase [Dehalobacter sp. DCM]|uniref:oxidoreductase n=1 Tax=Dehalobacter sp. DCM TaxID=2907827 RepID=UPI0030815E8A|nr:oxidoreductase [Dehalobacter sp. DCM]UWG98217.1 oxidoreductase [Dehalobacter sp. DCM]
MKGYGLLIDYEYCTGCHSCEVSCKNEHKIPLGKWGIKLAEVGPFKIDEDKWEWNYVPVPTQLCDLCEDRINRGEKPSCVLHCLGLAMDYGPVEELAKKMAAKGTKVTLFMP